MHLHLYALLFSVACSAIAETQPWDRVVDTEDQQFVRAPTKPRIANATAISPTTDCAIRQLAYEYALKLQPHRAPMRSVFDALGLEKDCHMSPPPGGKAKRHPNLRAPRARPADGRRVIHVYTKISLDGKEKAERAGYDCPFQGRCEFGDIAEAIASSREYNGNHTIVLHEGIHFLKKPLLLGPEDSGLTIQNADNEEAWISGGSILKANWESIDQPVRGKSMDNIWVTTVAHDVGEVLGLNTLTERLTRARYPNAYPEDRFTVKNLGGTTNILRWHKPPILAKPEHTTLNLTKLVGKDDSSMWQYNMYGNGRCKTAGDTNCPCGAWIDTTYGRDPVSESYWCSEIAAGGWANMDQGNGYYNGPVLPEGLTYNKTGGLGERAANWSSVDGAIVVAWRAQGWFVNMYAVKEHDKRAGELRWDRWSGGWQGGRGWQIESKHGEIDPIPPFFIENVFEELDFDKEWYFDRETRQLYHYHKAQDINSKVFIVPRLKELVGLRGEPGRRGIVRDITIRGIGFRDTKYTYMDRWGVPSGGDWALYRGGSVFIEGTEGVSVVDCVFKRVDGNAVMISGYNRRTVLENNEFAYIGDHAMASWGYSNESDASAGHYPEGILVRNNFAHEVGYYQLQSGMWFQAKSAAVKLEGNIFFNGPRSGINYNDGFAGGNQVVNNLLFNLCRHSGDHGPINSWDRQIFKARVPGTQRISYEPAYSQVEYNFIWANYGGSQGFDHDDGSSRYDMHHNFIYGEGLKMDYGGHDTLYHDNVNIVHKYDGQNCINTGPFAKGHGHSFTSNRCVVPFTEKYGTVYDCDVNNMKQAINQRMANNQYYTATGNAYIQCGGNADHKIPLEEWQIGTHYLIEQGSTVQKLPTTDEIVQWAKDLLW